ncbi:protein kinase domain-containing protein [Citrus sinensis]|uniref:Protein kinase domain-containing protein n=1 Tax=Citrus sinensis TaxID=2711 RepID=A0ACB8IUM3_CITSI|nr:protein kinase domain-containing protein [Citrus sinensis]
MVINCGGTPWLDARLTMYLFWWQQLPLLLLIQLLQSTSTDHKVYAEALLACKSALGAPRQSSGRIGRIFHRIPEICALSFNPNFFHSNSEFPFQEKNCKSRNRRIASSIGGDNGIPTLTPLQQDDVKRPRKQKLAAVVGGVVAALLVIGFVVFVYICLMCVKRRIRRSEGESSVPSPSAFQRRVEFEQTMSMLWPTSAGFYVALTFAELERGDISPYPGAVSPIDTQNLKQLTILELKHATNNFSEINIIGEGSFGLAYKGLLQDGSLVVIKRHLQTQIQNFLHEVKHIARVHHRHLVKLVGFCEENHQQLLIYDYIPNGNVQNHLYDSEGLPIGKLTMRQRLSIALGAAKGLEHLHSLVPPLFHMHFRTSNVLLEENYTAKVSDYGLLKLVTGSHHAGSTSAVDCFLDPELNLSKNYSAGSDVYSFGVFLLELIGGREAHGRNHSNSDQNLILQAKRSCDLGKYVDKTLGEQTVGAATEMMELALQCVDVSSRRPSMRQIAGALEGIQEREIGRLHSEFGEEIDAVKLGSELFK